jgi:hypothetical protein
VASYLDKLTLLRQRASDISVKLTALADKRRSYSLAATEGDKTAIKQVADTDFESDGLRREVQTLQSAIECAEALEKQQALDHEQEHQHQKQVEAYNHARAIIALSLEIDDALLHLRQMFERRASLLDGLARTEVCHPGFVARLQNKSVLTRASCSHGLHRHLSIETCSPTSMRPLAESNELLLGIGHPPDDKRLKFKQ